MEPTTVWAARLGSADEGVKGFLVLETEHVSFTSELSNVEIRIPLAEVRRVRRVHGSPVMVVEHGESVVAFYFAQPPPIITTKHPLDRRRQRGTSVNYLGGVNAEKRKDIKRWVRAIRDASKGARSA